MKIPAIDVFAGPGGLNEGFATCGGRLTFDIALAIEKNLHAVRTLQLRNFFRQFPAGKAPDLYYAYVRNEVSEAELFNAYPEQIGEARRRTWMADLKEVDTRLVIDRMSRAVEGHRHWVLLGGPPCQAYSTIGRSRMAKLEGFADDKRHTLYREYLKVVAAFQPTVFVMENVKGILSSRHKEQHVFPRILSDLRDPWSALLPASRRKLPRPAVTRGYSIFSFSTPALGDFSLKPADYLIEAEKYGIPQTRHRVILLGIRNDYAPGSFSSTVEEAAQLSVADVIGGMPEIRSALSSDETDGSAWLSALRKALHESGVLSELTDSRVRDAMLESVDAIDERLTRGGSFVRGGTRPAKLARWFCDDRLEGLPQHESRAHMSPDLVRYLFVACYSLVHGVSPKLRHFPAQLLPRHASAIRERNGRVDFDDRFRAQCWDRPATTVTAHLRKDGHYFIHPDPTQCRSLTVREAARLQTFPDNFFFEGPRGRQFEQIGNAVPPLLARKLAEVVQELLLDFIERDSVREAKVNVSCVGT
ncbi:DNA cytosine methyltransferase [Imhoffiella purpurea]|uniref:DNA (cytosine-5-)-methyltransferase n=1 Tax=Imhoffiella purpurea TaxID=1249627 RepID=W9V2M3_9GAMM|nr:DNA cytosine methyltransferase [Imhoffiella purpurea]EXJ13579.1 DNA-cytosine methyltransferase [Imhoffiella purpurea]